MPAGTGQRALASTIACVEQHWQLLADGRDCGALVLFPLDVPTQRRELLAALLSNDEKARAARFFSATHGEHYAVAHGYLRELLAPLLGLAPAAIEFATGAHGKPELAGLAAGSGLRFNLSHSAGLGLIGWCWQHEIGVDVEAWRATRDEAALVRRYFSPLEITAWEALAPARRHEAFFNLWTRKEAYVKAVGLGLALPLRSFDVSHESGAGARLLRTSALVAAGRAWSLAAPVIGAGVSAAVVLEACVCHIRNRA